MIDEDISSRSLEREKERSQGLTVEDFLHFLKTFFTF